MTLAEIIFNLRLQLKDNRTDDLKFSDRNLEFMINYVRAKLIRQDIQKGRKVSNNISQSLGVLELEITDASGDINFESEYNILKTIKPIPNAIEVDGNDMITFIAGLDNKNRIDFKSKAQAIKNSWNKYASKRIAAYLENNHIYIPNCNLELTYITVDGVFENPREVANFKRKDGEPCFDIYKDSYPISQNMIDMLNSIIKRQELDLYFQLIEDKINDGQTNI